MDALILAAGLGRRLAPLTDRTPKALVDVGGQTLLERVARRLIAAGADRLVVNVHHHAEQVVACLDAHDGFGVAFRVSHERDAPLETGGGMRAAANHLRRDRPFFVHNVDVLSDVSLTDMCAAHAQSDALATLAVMERQTTRHLRFDDRGLIGRDDDERGIEIHVRDAVGEVRALGFAGIHVVEPRFLDLLVEEGAFSVLVPYLRLAGAGERIDAFRVDGRDWMDLGRPAHLEEARRRFALR